VIALFARHWHFAAIAALMLLLSVQSMRLDHERAAHAMTEARWEKREQQARADLAARESHWRARMEDTAAALAAARAQAGQITETHTHEVRTYYKDRPADAVVGCLPDERVRAANHGRDAIHSAATG